MSSLKRHMDLTFIEIVIEIVIEMMLLASQNAKENFLFLSNVSFFKEMNKI